MVKKKEVQRSDHGMRKAGLETLHNERTFHNNEVVSRCSLKGIGLDSKALLTRKTVSAKVTRYSTEQRTAFGRIRRSSAEQYAAIARLEKSADYCEGLRSKHQKR